jgi:hypothetical protein
MRALETTGTFGLPDTPVAVAGDWHGNFDWIGRAIPAAARSGAETLLHAGDFGFWPGHTGALLASVDGWVKKTQQAPPVRHSRGAVVIRIQPDAFA